MRGSLRAVWKAGQGDAASSLPRLGPGCAASDQALLRALQEDVLGQFDPDEDHLAHALLALRPRDRGRCP